MQFKRVFMVATSLFAAALPGFGLAATLTPMAGSSGAFVFKPARANAAVPDTTPPNILSGPTVSCAAATTATLSATIDEAGTGYYQVSTSATVPSVSTVTSSGTSFAMTANNSATQNLTSLTANTNYYLYFVAKDTSNNVRSTVSTATFKTTGTSPYVATSVNAEDGYVYATSAGGSPTVGFLSTLTIGRDFLSNFNRAILSFDTSGIPTCATITQAYLTVNFSSISGDPWANPAGNTMVVDIRAGTFGTTAVETSDWADTPTAAAVATIAKFTSGSKASTDFSAAGIAAINRTGRTQIKLRFSSDQTSANYIAITGGTATLTVVYTP